MRQLFELIQRRWLFLKKNALEWYTAYTEGVTSLLSPGALGSQVVATLLLPGQRSKSSRIRQTFFRVHTGDWCPLLVTQHEAVLTVLSKSAAENPGICQSRLLQQAGFLKGGKRPLNSFMGHKNKEQRDYEVRKEEMSSMSAQRNGSHIYQTRAGLFTTCCATCDPKQWSNKIVSCLL